MDILLHVCCGPCTIYPLSRLREEGHVVKGYFFNPNIHPYREFKRRIASLVELADKTGFTVEIDRNYGLIHYLRQVVFHEQQRCQICYDMRLEPTVKKTVEQGADAFTTTLLYSRYQNHDLLKKKCEALAEKYGVLFYYEDFREGWQAGIDGSIDMGLYRQPYCGCIYSEQERYDKKLRKKKRR
ncbi:epoxyqueuosine reductase QueH [Desulfolithobacter sp.]